MKQTELLDSLTKQQRIGIAEIIRDADIMGDYFFNGEDSVYEESASETLDSLARHFESYDPESAIN